MAESLSFAESDSLIVLELCAAGEEKSYSQVLAISRCTSDCVPWRISIDARLHISKVPTLLFESRLNRGTKARFSFLFGRLPMPRAPRARPKG